MKGGYGVDELSFGGVERALPVVVHFTSESVTLLEYLDSVTQYFFFAVSI